MKESGTAPVRLHNSLRVRQVLFDDAIEVKIVLPTLSVNSFRSRGLGRDDDGHEERTYLRGDVKENPVPPPG
jgi:hypothetical protein